MVEEAKAVVNKAVVNKAVANKVGAVMYLHQIENRGNKAAPRFISGLIHPNHTTIHSVYLSLLHRLPPVLELPALQLAESSPS